MSANLKERQRKILLALPLFVWGIAFGGNAFISSSNSGNVTYSSDFKMNIPDSKKEVIKDKKSAYDAEINKPKEKAAAKIGWDFGNDLKKESKKDSLIADFKMQSKVDKDQELMNKILSGVKVDNNIYSKKKKKSRTSKLSKSTNNTYSNSNYSSPVTNSSYQNAQGKKEKKNYFNSVDGVTSDEIKKEHNEKNTTNEYFSKNISAEVFKDQTLKVGEPLMIMLKEDIIKNGKVIVSKNKIVYGVTKLKNGRISIVVNNANINGKNILLGYKVYNEHMELGFAVENMDVEDLAYDEGESISEHTSSTWGNVAEDVVKGVGSVIKKTKKPKAHVLSGTKIFLIKI